MPPKKGKVGGEGKGPAQCPPAKRPPPQPESSSDEENTDLSAILSRIAALERDNAKLKQQLAVAEASAPRREPSARKTNSKHKRPCIPEQAESGDGAQTTEPPAMTRETVQNRESEQPNTSVSQIPAAVQQEHCVSVLRDQFVSSLSKFLEGHLGQPAPRVASPARTPAAWIPPLLYRVSHLKLHRPHRLGLHLPYGLTCGPWGKGGLFSPLLSIKSRFRVSIQFSPSTGLYSVGQSAGKCSVDCQTLGTSEPTMTQVSSFAAVTLEGELLKTLRLTSHKFMSPREFYVYAQGSVIPCGVVSTPIRHHLILATKDKIWREEFVDRE